ncbi:hypothetical protein F5H01DRAFT_340056 [Linnemannia elongata]|nr:hypothetical protein F5H01DRAFT_340056 [Linnemannia elongata]
MLLLELHLLLLKVHTVVIVAASRAVSRRGVVEVGVRNVGNIASVGQVQIEAGLTALALGLKLLLGLGLSMSLEGRGSSSSRSWCCRLLWRWLLLLLLCLRRSWWLLLTSLLTTSLLLLAGLTSLGGRARPALGRDTIDGRASVGSAGPVGGGWWRSGRSRVVLFLFSKEVHPCLVVCLCTCVCCLFVLAV